MFFLIDPFCHRHWHATTTLQPSSLVKILCCLLLFFFALSLFSFSLASNINAVFLVLMCWVRPMVSREKEKIRFSVSLFFFLSFYLNLCSSSKLASCFGCKHYWRDVMEEVEVEKEDEHVKTRSMCVYKHISILLHYSFFLFIYLFLPQTCIKTNSSEHTTISLIPNGKRPLFSIPSSLLRRVSSANRSIIT